MYAGMREKKGVCADTLLVAPSFRLSRTPAAERLQRFHFEPADLPKIEKIISEARRLDLDRRDVTDIQDQHRTHAEGAKPNHPASHFHVAS